MNHAKGRIALAIKDGVVLTILLNGQVFTHKESQ